MSPYCASWRETGYKEQDPFIQCAGKSPDGLAKQAGPLETRQRDATELTKTGITGQRSSPPSNNSSGWTKP
ncbi:hypothetical protein OKW11_005025 [Pseudomonas baetica]|nr:hypothetical protein [Pseudomonas baetica]